jgi:hypothetical protein
VQKNISGTIKVKGLVIKGDNFRYELKSDEDAIFVWGDNLKIIGENKQSQITIFGHNNRIRDISGNDKIIAFGENNVLVTAKDGQRIASNPGINKIFTNNKNIQIPDINFEDNKLNNNAEQGTDKNQVLNSIKQDWMELIPDPQLPVELDTMFKTDMAPNIPELDANLFEQTLFEGQQEKKFIKRRKKVSKVSETEEGQVIRQNNIQEKPLGSIFDLYEKNNSRINLNYMSSGTSGRRFDHMG